VLKLKRPTAAATSTTAATSAGRPRRQTSVGNAHPSAPAVTGALPSRRHRSGGISSGSNSSSSDGGGSDAGTSSAAIPELQVGMLIRASGEEQCKTYMQRLLNGRLNHHTRVANSRRGYYYFQCKLCDASCGVSKNVSRNKKWHVTVCSDDMRLPCTRTRSAESVSVSLGCAPSRSSAPAPVASASPAVECFSCGIAMEVMVPCTGQARHQLCQECFNSAVYSRITANENERMQFMTSGKIFCQYCFREAPRILSPYDMQKCAPFLSQGNYDAYMELCNQKQVSKIQEALEARLRASNRELEIAKSQDPEAARIGACVRCCIVCIGDLMIFTEHMINDIGEECVQPRCPHCSAICPGFTGCCALECTSCSLHFCGWCLTGFEEDSNACHSHVRICAYNPPSNRGQLYPPSPHPQVWQEVMWEWARKRIVDRIRSHHESLQTMLHERVRSQFPEVGLPESQAFTHAYRAPKSRARAGTKEENITTLMSMGIATRPRAVQVLDFFQNDLSKAVDMLLALKNK